MAARLPRSTTLSAAVACLASVSVLAAGCGASSSETEPVADSGATALAAGSPSSSIGIAPTGPAAGTELTLAFAGDVHFTGRTATLLRKPSTAFGKIIPALSGADLTILNLETAVTQRGTAQPKTYTFRAPATTFDALRAAGVDAVSLANNHALDFGQVGFTDTLDNAERANFPVFGGGRNATEANAPWIVTVRGVRIAVFGFSQIQELSSTWIATETRPGLAIAVTTDRAIAAVQAARKQADLIVVFNHWGQERNQCPTSAQKDFAKKLVKAGANIIVGSHAHTLQGAGSLNGSFVAYGMGNFLWYGNSASTDTGVLRLTVQGTTVTKHQLIPAVVSGTGQPVPLTGQAATKLTKRFADLRGCTGLAKAPA
ncbi:MAG: CapA family protein [Micromonosporaceae bacterium]|nr:CapA family protein [Micromonosporaceae bacterium]